VDGEEREPAAAEVVPVLVLLGLAQCLAVEQVGRVEAAAVEQEADAVVVVAGGDDLVGALEPAGRDTAVALSSSKRASKVFTPSG
jgi:hypothetical protein